MSKKSPFAIQKALVGIGGVPKWTNLNSPLTISPHNILNSCRGVLSEPDMLTTPDAETLDGLFDQGVIQVRRITINKDTTVSPNKHIILTFSSLNLPKTIKAGYLNFKIRPYIPNHVRCFKFQRFGHSQANCRGQLTCSRCASSSSTQGHLLSSTSLIAATNSEPQSRIPTYNDAPSTNEMFTRIESSSSIIPTSLSKSIILSPSDSNTVQDAKKISKPRARKRKKELRKKMIDAIIEIKMAPHR
ncbi:uncharacterized protein TNCV_3477881 [Trichonephila clavipes]|nr:uncharacterized protein TNCV_3477881 [Trichonephila clavipes]